MVTEGPTSADRFLEIKRIARCPTYFPPNRINIKCGGVKLRTGKIQSEYESKANTADVLYNAYTGPVGQGPCGRRLGEYGRIGALIIGPRASLSDDLHKLIVTIATIGGERGMRCDASAPLPADWTHCGEGQCQAQARALGYRAR